MAGDSEKKEERGGKGWIEFFLLVKGSFSGIEDLRREGEEGKN